MTYKSFLFLLFNYSHLCFDCSKKRCRLFKFSGSAVEVVSPSVERGEMAAAAGYKFVCSPAPEHLTHIYHVLDDFMDEIESRLG